MPPPLRPLALPWTLPYAVAKQLLTVAETDAGDAQSLQTAAAVRAVVQPRLRAAVEQVGTLA